VVTPIAARGVRARGDPHHYLQDLINAACRPGARRFESCTRVPSSRVDDEGSRRTACRQRARRARPGRFFSNPWLWVGLVVAAGFVAAAIWMRRYREPL
jgi:hypothetical protein